MKTLRVEYPNGPDGDAVLVFPEDLCDSMGWEVGDTLKFKVDSDGTVTIEKVEKIMENKCHEPIDAYMECDCFDKAMLKRLKDAYAYHASALANTKELGKVTHGMYSWNYKAEVKYIKKKLKALRAVICYYGFEGLDFDAKQKIIFDK